MKTQMDLVNDYNDTVVSSISSIEKKLSELVSECGVGVKVDSIVYGGCYLSLIDSETGEKLFGTDIEIDTYSLSNSPSERAIRIITDSDSFNPAEEPEIGLKHMLIFHLSNNTNGCLDLMKSKMNELHEKYENLLEF